MSQNAREDHRKFCQMISGYVERLERDFPHYAKKDRPAMCYRFFDVFVVEFPETEGRDVLLSCMQKTQEMFAAAMGEEGS